MIDSPGPISYAVEARLLDADVVVDRVVVRELDAEVLARRHLDAVGVELQGLDGSHLDVRRTVAFTRRRRRRFARREGSHVRVVVGARHRVHLEDHVVVADAAELGALPGVGPRLGDHELDLVRRGVLAHVDRVSLDQELGHEKGVVHVGRLQHEPHRLTDRQRKVGRLTALPADDGPVGIVELPGPLLRHDRDRHARLVRPRLHRAEGDDAHDEQHEDDDRWDGRPQDLDLRVAVVLLGERVVARLAAVADDRVDDEALDREEHQGREYEHEHVQVEDVLPGVGLGIGRKQAAAQQRHDEQQSAGTDDVPRSRSGPRMWHQLVRGSWFLNRRIPTRRERSLRVGVMSGGRAQAAWRGTGCIVAKAVTRQPSSGPAPWSRAADTIRAPP